MIKVKICGITSPEDAKLAVQCGADYVGLVFFEGSPRHVSPLRAFDIASVVDRHSSHVVGVFVDRPVEEVASLVSQVGLDLVQIHGQEDEEYVRRLRQLTAVPIVRAARVRSVSGVKKALSTTAEHVLLDSFVSGKPGGTGKRFDWSFLNGMNLDRVFLAGGIAPENVAEAVSLRPFAIDVSSGVEAAPGRKDPAKLRLLFQCCSEARA